MSQFAFLQHEWPEIASAPSSVEKAVHAAPHTTCFYAQRVRSACARRRLRIFAQARNMTPQYRTGETGSES